ncbi:hypothetical protein SLITO_v1c03400 [Spiroplasma litorale]|uniref:Uncharacterized protein n=1 Tax=Spiroplasma litorale TaxID=216942 RepID=A0A0K1W0Z2_9MOLU|nr:hypothetical protein [Spiroplasma litorale]AKX33994.1 hypothetical protein SLITO_v1c03400 [Spiroplasma litorale]
MKKWVTTKNIATCGVLTAIMFVMGAIVSTIASMTGKSIIQFSDIIYLILFGKVNLFTLILSAVIAGSMIDLYSGGAIFIPITILVKILIGLTYKLLNKKLNIHLIYIISYLWVFIYNLYSYILWDTSVLIVELIVNSIQYSVTVGGACLIILTSSLNIFNKNEATDYKVENKS